MTKKFKKYFYLKNYVDYLGYLNRRRKFRRSYSQCGEDILVECALSTLKINKPSYIDIGTNHPIFQNNTFLFYQKGGSGLCIEPNPELFKVVKDTRGRDICLNVGIATFDSDSLSFYIMSSGGLSTFAKSEAEKYVKENNYGAQKIEKIINVPVIAVNSILKSYFPDGLDIMSLDAEGYDFDILKSLDFEKHRPKVICVETLRYETGGKLKKQSEIASHMVEQGYFLYADTYVNSIFVDKKIWPF